MLLCRAATGSSERSAAVAWPPSISRTMSGHDRRVALKVLRAELAALVGAERFLAEIRTTGRTPASAHPAAVDSGEADGPPAAPVPLFVGMFVAYCWSATRSPPRETRVHRTVQSRRCMDWPDAAPRIFVQRCQPVPQERVEARWLDLPPEAHSCDARARHADRVSARSWACATATIKRERSRS
jgi:hypothetical protein